MSRLHPKKGIEAFLDAWLAVTLAGQFKSWKLIIAGDGDAKYVGSLKGQVSSREATAQVRFVGWVSGASKIALLSDAGFLALTSQQENFGIAVAEALACGTPVLVSEHVGLAAEVESSRLGWVTTSIAEEVKRSLTTILACEDEMRERGAAGRAYARQHFVWSRIAQALISLYSSLDMHAN
jgi:glycosyltransferase involved in cell wall biosynthesis